MFDDKPTKDCPANEGTLHNQCPQDTSQASLLDWPECSNHEGIIEINQETQVWCLHNGTCPYVCEKHIDCPDQTTRCDDKCVDLQTDPDHCGKCNRSINKAKNPNRVEYCAQGEIVSQCVAGFTQCTPDLCVNLDEDSTHCGDCNTKCEQGQICRSFGDQPARCVTCADLGLVDFEGNCVDLASDPQHCGALGQSCPGNELARCENGYCTRCVLLIDEPGGHWLIGGAEGETLWLDCPNMPPSTTVRAHFQGVFEDEVNDPYHLGHSASVSFAGEGITNQCPGEPYSCCMAGECCSEQSCLGCPAGCGQVFDSSWAIFDVSITRDTMTGGTISAYVKLGAGRPLIVHNGTYGELVTE